MFDPNLTIKVDFFPVYFPFSYLSSFSTATRNHFNFCFVFRTSQQAKRLQGQKTFLICRITLVNNVRIKRKRTELNIFCSI
jgi:hypothetical protein